jgi:peptidoglycan/LPS O-acetylase OafA/YrhL
LHVPHQPDTSGQPFGLAYWLWLPVDLGFLGVLLFIVVSGFCIHHNTLRDSPTAELCCRWGRFWKRRLVRLYPPYLVVILGCAALVCATNIYRGASLSEALRWIRADLLCHSCMVHNLLSNYAYGLNNGPLWTLGMEEQLYLLYFLLLAARRVSLRTMLLLTLLVSGLVWQIWRLGAPVPLQVGPVSLSAWSLWPFHYWFTWTLGAVAAEAYAGRITLPTWCYRPQAGLLFFLLGLLTHVTVWLPLTGKPSVGETVASLGGWSGLAAEMSLLVSRILLEQCWPLAFFILVNVWVRREMEGIQRHHFLARCCGWVGQFSYSLYLTHVPVIITTLSLVPLRSVVVRYLLLVPLAVGVAWLFYLLVERRFLRKTPASPQQAGQAGPERRAA